MLDALDLSRDCMPLWQSGSIRFYPPVELAELDTPAVERDPFVSQDELTIYFSQEHAAAAGGVDADIYTAKRAQITEPFGSAAPFSIVNTSSYESKMSISLDGLALVVCRSEGTGGNDDYLATRTSTTQAWTAPQLNYMDNVNGEYSPYDPELGSDGKTMYFAPTDGVNPQQLALASRSNLTSDFEVDSIGGYNPSATDQDADPWADPSGRLLVFSRSTVDVGDVDIYYALGSASGFGAPKPVPDINTLATSDADPWVSPNGCRVYFASNRTGGLRLVRSLRREREVISRAGR